MHSSYPEERPQVSAILSLNKKRALPSGQRPNQPNLQQKNLLPLFRALGFVLLSLFLHRDAPFTRGPHVPQSIALLGS